MTITSLTSPMHAVLAPLRTCVRVSSAREAPQTHSSDCHPQTVYACDTPTLRPQSFVTLRGSTCVLYEAVRALSGSPRLEVPAAQVTLTSPRPACTCTSFAQPCGTAAALAASRARPHHISRHAHRPIYHPAEAAASRTGRPLYPMSRSRAPAPDSTNPKIDATIAATTSTTASRRARPRGMCAIAATPSGKLASVCSLRCSSSSSSRCRSASSSVSPSSPKSPSKLPHPSPSPSSASLASDPRPRTTNFSRDLRAIAGAWVCAAARACSTRRRALSGGCQECEWKWTQRRNRNKEKRYGVPAASDCARAHHVQQHPWDVLAQRQPHADRTRRAAQLDPHIHADTPPYSFTVARVHVHDQLIRAREPHSRTRTLLIVFGPLPAPTMFSSVLTLIAELRLWLTVVGIAVKLKRRDF
ncbi:hypothetical protein DFH09DRAFT_1328448 [Mycena vulgaris]|nr:hypothetical protein DFH09DRAFT_1415525 [Mycena vulgaris]KAJ6526605.1 hypothetical protein DFH09DRAFT_1328448 [Mycena vulgaris]